MKETGVIKYDCNWIKDSMPDYPILADLIYWRALMYNKTYIGVYPDGIGYGNISHRLEHQEFIISGSATGMLHELTNNHFTLVTDYNINQNSLTCKGPIQASSESLTHAAIYNCNATIHAIIHIHNFELWNKLVHKVPTTSSTVAYGTPAMAIEIERLFNETDVKKTKIIIMAGHEEGIIVFGNTLKDAGEILEKFK